MIGQDEKQAFNILQCQADNFQISDSFALSRHFQYRNIYIIQFENSLTNQQQMDPSKQTNQQYRFFLSRNSTSIILTFSCPSETLPRYIGLIPQTSIPESISVYFNDLSRLHRHLKNKKNYKLFLEHLEIVLLFPLTNQTAEEQFEDDLSQFVVGPKIVKNSKKVLVLDVPMKIQSSSIFLDSCSAFLNKFKINGKKVTYMGENQAFTQILASTPMVLKDNFSFKVLRTKSRMIAFGIIDSKLRKQRWTHYKSPWMVCYYANDGGVRGSSLGVIRFQTKQIYQGDIVSVKLDFLSKTVTWYINGEQSSSFYKHNLNEGAACWVPFIRMRDTGDTVQIIS